MDAPSDRYVDDVMASLRQTFAASASEGGYEGQVVSDVTLDGEVVTVHSTDPGRGTRSWTFSLGGPGAEQRDLPRGCSRA